MKEITKSYAINRIAELTQENERLKAKIKDLELCRCDDCKTECQFMAEKTIADLEQQLRDQKEQIVKEIEDWVAENCHNSSRTWADPNNEVVVNRSEIENYLTDLLKDEVCDEEQEEK